jgi:hypothetical protein
MRKAALFVLVLGAARAQHGDQYGQFIGIEAL